MCKKIKYPSEASARRGLRSAQRSKAPGHKECRTYFCNYCKAYHLTSGPIDNVRRLRKKAAQKQTSIWKQQ